MKKILLSLTLCLTLLSGVAQTKNHPTMFAHRGCWSKNDAKEFIVPENSLPAVAMAKKMGYTGIECDVHYTKDKRMVILHDGTINRTMRRAADYSKLDKPVRLEDLTFEEIRRDYVLESENPAWRTPIPTLEELLTECKKHGVMPMLHSALMESYKVAQEMFGNDWICFTGGVAHMQKVREFSDCLILLSINSGTAEETLDKLRQIGGHCGVSTMNYKLYTPEFCKALTDAGYEVQASIFPAPHETVAQRNGVTYQLTDFSFMPPAGKKPKYSYKINMSKLGILQLVLSKKHKRLPQDHYEYGGEVIEITARKGTSGLIKANINGKEYEFHTNGEEKIYIGRRLMDSETLNVSANSNSRVFNGKKRTNMKRVKFMFYEM